VYLRQENCNIQLGHAAPPHEQHEPHQCELPKPDIHTQYQTFPESQSVADRLRTYMSSASQYRYAGTYCDHR